MLEKYRNTNDHNLVAVCKHIFTILTMNDRTESERSLLFSAMK